MFTSITQNKSTFFVCEVALFWKDIVQTFCTEFYDHWHIVKNLKIKLTTQVEYIYLYEVQKQPFIFIAQISPL